MKSGKQSRMNVIDLECNNLSWRSWEEVADFCNENNIKIRENSPIGVHGNLNIPATTGIAYNTGRRALYKLAKSLMITMSTDMDDDQLHDLSLSIEFQKFIYENWEA